MSATYTALGTGSGFTSGPSEVPCHWCGGWHSAKCPMVKAIEYHPNGMTKRVEFYELSGKP